MSYSRETLVAFSEALRELHSDRGADGYEIRNPDYGARVKGPTTTRSENRQSEPALRNAQTEDRTFLDALYAEHVFHLSTRPSAPRRDAQDMADQPAQYLPLRAFGLTPRECEVAFWIAQGKRDAEIACLLGSTTRTVSKHVERILRKLRAPNRVAAVDAAERLLRSCNDPA